MYVCRVARLFTDEELQDSSSNIKTVTQTNNCEYFDTKPVNIILCTGNTNSLYTYTFRIDFI